jgi:hypothetical protein
MENNVTLTKTGTGSLLSVAANNSVILQDITLKGNDGNNTALVTVSGNLTMKDGSRITGNTSSANTTGGGVNIATGGVFTMDGGSIDNNKSTANAGKGGGVYGVGTFTMRGGTIKENEAGTSTSGANSLGGGVYLTTAGVFTMRGGTISNNKALAKNSSLSFGGGVAVFKFTMEGGDILNNTAVLGGGIDIETNAASYFTMSGGTIAGNTASGQGAAFLAYKYITFSKTGGAINGTSGSGANCGTEGTSGVKAIAMWNATTTLTNPVIAWNDTTHGSNDSALTYTWTTGSLTISSGIITAGLKNITLSGNWSKCTYDWSK